MKQTDIEQRRRDLKAREPDLYQYIVDVELAKALDSAGDTASGRSEAVANQLWSASADRSRAAERARHGE